MEHIDALEAVRRLTLERDALAEQVRRLEADRDEWKAAFHKACMDISVNPLQAPERRERAACQKGQQHPAPEATTAPQKWDGLVFGGRAARLKEQYNGTQTCDRCKYADISDNNSTRAWCKRHAPKPLTDLMGGARWPIVSKDDTCGDWEGK